MLPEQFVKRLVGRKIRIKYDDDLESHGLISSSPWLITVNSQKCAGDLNIILAVIAHECGHYEFWNLRPRYRGELLSHLYAIQKCHENKLFASRDWLIADLLVWFEGNKNQQKAIRCVGKDLCMYLYEVWNKQLNEIELPLRLFFNLLHTI